MVVEAFPDPETADENGLLAVGGDLDPETLVLAYRSGIFPWPPNRKLLAWFSPPKRGVIVLADLHISKSLASEVKKTPFRLAINTRCREVIEQCAHAKNRTGHQGTWITKEMVDAYVKLHHLKIVHSFECFEGEKLVGGLYGVALGGFFAGESMFYLKDNASKFCLWAMAIFLKSLGVPWVDCQMVTPLTGQFGAKEITRREYLEMLEKRIKGNALQLTQSRFDGALKTSPLARLISE